ncbi:MAG: LuxR C-terminal-related transcriptional regulator, partial [Nocardioides sp.]
PRRTQTEVVFFLLLSFVVFSPPPPPPPPHRRSGDPDTGGLNPRELVILDLLAEGLSANKSGHLLGISDRTVQKHIERIYRNLGVTDRRQAVVEARAHGIL